MNPPPGWNDSYGPPEPPPGRRGGSYWTGYRGAPPWVPLELAWIVWIVREVGVPLALLAWFVLRADGALADLAESQRATVQLLDQVLLEVRR